MGSKYKLAKYLHQTFKGISFESATDAFSGSGVVSYLLKSMGKCVSCNDMLLFPSILTSATIQNDETILDEEDLAGLMNATADTPSHRFINRTFSGIFFTNTELDFLDNVWDGIRKITNTQKRSIAISAMLRSAIKRQPRGHFTVAGDPERYKDNRRDLSITIHQHFKEQVAIYNEAVFTNGQKNTSGCGDVFSLPPGSDLVYMDPPYIPQANDNCYMKRYHFLEGLACYWEGKELQISSKVKKISKPFTPFSYKVTAIEAFDKMFRKFAESILVLSYSVNAFPDIEILRALMRRYKKSVEVLEIPYLYSFGTRPGTKNNRVKEYIMVGL